MISNETYRLARRALDALVASVQDVITGFPVSGSARGLEVLLAATGIITGVAATLYLAESLGVTPTSAR